MLIRARKGNQTGLNLFFKEQKVRQITIQKMENIIDKIDAIKANTVSEKEFKSVWGISLDEHIKNMMEYVREADARIAKERADVK